MVSVELFNIEPSSGERHRLGRVHHRMASSSAASDARSKGNKMKRRGNIRSGMTRIKGWCANLEQTNQSFLGARIRTLALSSSFTLWCFGVNKPRHHEDHGKRFVSSDVGEPHLLSTRRRLPNAQYGWLQVILEASRPPVPRRYG